MKLEDFDLRNKEFRKHFYYCLLDYIYFHDNDYYELKNLFTRLDQKNISDDDILKVHFILEDHERRRTVYSHPLIDIIYFEYKVLQKGGFKKFVKIFEEETSKGNYVLTFPQRLILKIMNFETLVCTKPRLFFRIRNFFDSCTYYQNTIFPIIVNRVINEM